MDNIKGHFPGCGEFCGTCSYHTGNKQPYCPGCNVVKGKPFWGECKIFECINKHGIEHCGLCEEFPCDEFINHYEEALPEGQKNAIFRAGLLAYRSKHGDVKTVELLKSLIKT